MSAAAETPTIKSLVIDEFALNIAPRQRRQERWSFIDSVFLLLVLCALALFLVHSPVSQDPDLWWHLRTGSWILQHGAVPVQDSFSSPRMGAPWIEYTWLFDIVLARLYDAGGIRGILALSVGLMLAATVALTALLARYTHLIRALMLVAAARVAMFPLSMPRPWLFTILFFTVELYLLLEACESGRKSWLVPIVPLLALWANLHIQFVYGLGLLGWFALDRSLARGAGKKLRSSRLWFLLAASSLATLANPYGWRLYIVVVQYATERAPYQLIQEMQALKFRDIGSWAALLLVCAAWFVLGKAPKRTESKDAALLMVLLAVSCWFGFRSVRDVWFPATIAAWVIASATRPVEAVVSRLRWMWWMIAVLPAFLFAFSMMRSGSQVVSALRKEMIGRYPEQAVAYIRGHGLPGPLYNPYDWGGYLIWRLPEMPVSIDGRANLHGDERLTQSVNTTTAKEGWDEDRGLKAAGTILLVRDSALASVLRSDSRYRLVYQDGVASVFQPIARPIASVP